MPKVLRLQEVSRNDIHYSRALWEQNSVARLLSVIVAAANECAKLVREIDRMFTEHEAQLQCLGRAADSVLKAYTLFKYQGSSPRGMPNVNSAFPSPPQTRPSNDW